MLWLWAVEDFTTFGTLYLQKLESVHHSGSSPMRPDKLDAEPPGHKPLFVTVVVVGPFEEEEEGTGIASDVIKVQGEDPDTPGYLRGDRVRRDVGDLGSWVRPHWLARHETPVP